MSPLGHGNMPTTPTASLPTFTLEFHTSLEVQPDGQDPTEIFLTSNGQSGAAGAYTTQAGDCIVVAACIAGTVTFTASGYTGTTWVVTQVGSAPTAALIIGYDVPAGINGSNGAFSIGGVGSTTSGDYVVAVFSGVLTTADPIRNSVSATSGGSAENNITTSSLNYNAGDLIIGMAGAAAGNVAEWGTASWGNGASNINIFQSQQNGASSRPVTLDYQAVPSANGSTTLTDTLAASGSTGIRNIALALKHA